MHLINSIDELRIGDRLIYQDSAERLKIEVLRIDYSQKTVFVSNGNTEAYLTPGDFKTERIFSEKKLKPKTKRETTIQILSSMDNATVEEIEGHVLISYYQEKRGRFCLAYFSPRSIKPDFHYYYKDFASRAEEIARAQIKIDRDIEKSAKDSARAQQAAEAIKPGAILSSSWGFDQTNVNFYLIIKKSGSSVTLQEIGKKDFTYSTDMSGHCMPDAEKFKGEPFKKRITQRGDIALASYQWASLWDGKPCFWSSWA